MDARGSIAVMAYHYMEMSEKCILMLKEIIEGSGISTFFPTIQVNLTSLQKFLEEWKNSIPTEKKTIALKNILVQGRKIVEIYIDAILQFNTTQSIEASINLMESIVRRYNMKNGSVPSFEECIVPPADAVANDAEALAARNLHQRKAIVLGRLSGEKYKYMVFLNDPIGICSLLRTIKTYGNICAHKTTTETVETTEISIGPSHVFEMVNGLMTIFSKISFQPFTPALASRIVDSTTMPPSSSSSTKKSTTSKSKAAKIPAPASSAALLLPPPPPPPITFSSILVASEIREKLWKKLDS